MAPHPTAPCGAGGGPSVPPGQHCGADAGTPGVRSPPASRAAPEQRVRLQIRGGCRAVPTQAIGRATLLWGIWDGTLCPACGPAQPWGDTEGLEGQREPPLPWLSPAAGCHCSCSQVTPRRTGTPRATPLSPVQGRVRGDGTGIPGPWGATGHGCWLVPTGCRGSGSRARGWGSSELAAEQVEMVVARVAATSLAAGTQSLWPMSALLQTLGCHWLGCPHGDQLPGLTRVMQLGLTSHPWWLLAPYSYMGEQDKALHHLGLARSCPGDGARSPRGHRDHVEATSSQEWHELERHFHAPLVPSSQREHLPAPGPAAPGPAHATAGQAPALALPWARGCSVGEDGRGRHKTRAKAGGDKALLSYSSDGRRDAGMHTHMQIGRLARHTRWQAPHLCRPPHGTSTSRWLIRPVLPTPMAGRGTGCRRPRSTHLPQRVTPGKGTGQYRGHCQDSGRGFGSLHPPYGKGEGGTKLQVKKPVEGPPAPRSVWAGHQPHHPTAAPG